MNLLKVYQNRFQIYWEQSKNRSIKNIKYPPRAALHRILSQRNHLLTMTVTGRPHSVATVSRKAQRTHSKKNMTMAIKLTQYWKKKYERHLEYYQREKHCNGASPLISHAGKANKIKKSTKKKNIMKIKCRLISWSWREIILFCVFQGLEKWPGWSKIVT